ncbi:hypothetical protein FH972_022707 [Carpinus fangiana]|uniref:Uncharacterized protein n=1 Tax=Carpinus fangiana TaxID=176857 RepID=A0A5N6KT08_9ROSI|nr:hypothetical protein FH972_022707 [Carpinus fangiana]
MRETGLARAWERGEGARVVGEGMGSLAPVRWVCHEAGCGEAEFTNDHDFMRHYWEVHPTLMDHLEAIEKEPGKDSITDGASIAARHGAVGRLKSLDVAVLRVGIGACLENVVRVDTSNGLQALAGGDVGVCGEGDRNGREERCGRAADEGISKEDEVCSGDWALVGASDETAFGLDGRNGEYIVLRYRDWLGDSQG